MSGHLSGVGAHLQAAMPAAALDEYCGSTFWNASFLDTPEPDLPVCLEQTVLVWLPLGFLWLCGPWHLAALFRGRGKPSQVSRLYLSKQLVAGLLFIIAIAGLALTLGEDYGAPSGAGSHALVFYVNPIIYAISWMLVLLYQEGVRRREGAVDSSTLFLFWLLLVCCDVFPFQTILREALRLGEVPDIPRYSLFYASFALELVGLVLSALADVPRQAAEVVKKNPEAGAAFLSRITFNWFNSMVVNGYKRPLVQEDLWELKEADSTSQIHRHFHSHMESQLGAARLRYAKKKSDPRPAKQNGVSQDVLMMEEMEGKKKDKKGKKGKEEKVKEDENYPQGWLIFTIFKCFKRTLIESAFFKLLQDLLAFVSPQLLKLMISFTKNEEAPDWHGYMYSVLLVLVAVLQSLFLQQYFQRCFVLGMKVRTSIMAAVYKKALVVSNSSRKETTVGETVNLMSADAQRFNDIFSFIHLLWSCPLQILLAIVFLWLELGPSVLAGLAVMVLMVPINGFLATKARKLQIKNMEHKDKRLKIMNEILNGMKILKLFAWEPSFQTQVEGIRGQELQVMRKFAYLNSFSTFIFYCAPSLVSLATFGVFVAVSSENVLDAEKAFTSIALFNILRFPLTMLPMLIAIMVQTAVSKKRLEKFLGGDDLDPDIVRHDSSFNTAVSICDGTFTWEKEVDPVLKNISLDVGRGKLVAVVGAVGSGKSSLISAILGELHSVKGFVNLQGSVAYVPQQAWIQNATLRDNILFGGPHDSDRFQGVLDACALGPDLELLPGRDLTEIGEKGINLSGGQKQRISLARAAYSHSDIYLLDDPLSAVDSHVGKHLFREVIGPKGLLKDKTRILVTHGVSFLPYVDEIVVLVEGAVSEVGSYQSLRATKGAFSEFLDTYAKEENRQQAPAAEAVGVEVEEEEEVSGGEDLQADCAPEDVVTGTLKREGSIRRSLRSQGSVRLRSNSSSPKKELATDMKKGQRLIEKETMETGQVKFSMYLQYLRAVGWGYSTMMFLMYLVQNVAFIGQNLWLSDWTTDSVDYFNMTYPASKRDTRVGVFGALGVAQGLFVFLGTLFMAEGSVSASSILHSRLLHTLLRVPMVFFDTTPTGRVVNRFAKDIFTVDEALPQCFRSWILCLLGVVGTLFVICLTTPTFAVVIIPLAVVYYFVQRFYVGTSRQLRRLDSVSRSPIYSHFGETVAGLSVIRAYGHQERFLKHNETTMDENIKSVYPWIVSNRWLAIRLEFLGNLVVFFSALFAVIARKKLDSGLVGLSISYSLNVTQTLNWLVRMTSELETNIVAVERVSEYSELETEAEWASETRPPAKWPDAGRLQFDNYKVRYRPELDLVLNGISCDISSTEKIGIVGRTGAGKSSLTNCLFRIIEAAEGRILIDGIDISKIGLHDLRNRLTIIPQDPVLFSGSLRMNLDPFENFSDQEIWIALELSHLKEYVAGLEKGLQYEVSEGGENLSVGQRQLLCLGRALLRKSRILILDEATAAVDLETDDLIQTTIRKEFSHCTVLTIAHRLQSIMDSSRVMVLDAGRIVEFDSPENLLEKQGYFYAMTKDAGITTGEATAL
ncbi:canalicular multispecific organic anion transporter 1 isoform X3 [Gadus macrocephalus]|uniref:canalicular multispecific organic anion transporter 1 isoform X3 n=1 Tax=Gadus macrocephalus TaxID=80720 RepID=UPI0028CBA483|nr:canalicular multispecific organic anion transporter 1 isoform X3 [Gadus macrocephalus]